MTDDTMALPSDRAFVPSASSPAVSPVPASIPSAVLYALAERSENGSGRDIHLESDVRVAVEGREPPRATFTPAYTISVDAVLALLPDPGHWRRLTHSSASVYSRNPYGQDAIRYDGNHVEPARALLAAHLRSVAAPIAAAESRARRAAPNGGDAK